MLFQLINLPGTYPKRVDSLRALAIHAADNPTDSSLYKQAKAFCASHFASGELAEGKTQCEVALHPDSILARFGRGKTENPLQIRHVRSWVPLYSTSRPEVAEYLRRSGGSEAFSVASKFSANVGEKEAYVVTSLVRGLIGRLIFSADQAAVIARSDDPNLAKRDTVEGERANVIRAVNNGGTLVGRFTVPLWARSGSTAVTAVGLSASGGIIGPLDGESPSRTGSGSTALEGLASFPIRDLNGLSNVLAELVIGGRVGYTYTGQSLRTSGGPRDVSFGQLLVGLRQNGNMSVSALVTLANHGMNDLVPKLAVNFAASR